MKNDRVPFTEMNKIEKLNDAAHYERNKLVKKFYSPSSFLFSNGNCGFFQKVTIKSPSAEKRFMNPNVS